MVAKSEKFNDDQPFPPKKMFGVTFDCVYIYNIYIYISQSILFPNSRMLWGLYTIYVSMGFDRLRVPKVVPGFEGFGVPGFDGF